ncbi:MAG: DinB family protein [Chloroflexota bacterium]
MVDLSPFANGEKKYIDIWNDDNLTIDDLRDATNESVDFLLGLISDLSDEQIVFEPVDEEAKDPYAEDGEQEIAWNIGHLVAHVTSSSEEGAAFSSILARGVEGMETRPRYETPWREIDTTAKAVQRLEESRRMRLAYLNTWPDEPDYDNARAGVSERFLEYFGVINAPAAFLMGLGHEHSHYEQIKDAVEQAKAAISA